MATAPAITLLTDYGTSDHYVAAVKGVILGLCPGVPLVDITHEIAAFSVMEGAFTLAQAWQSFPSGTVHLAVVDPGVGSSRRAIAASAGGHLFVGPDNGLLGLALAGCGTHTVREITAKEYFREPVSSTFHGRDIFGPVAARLAAGLEFEAVGPVIDDWFRPAFSEPSRLSRKSWGGTVLKVDHFGNLVTNFASKDFPIRDEEFNLQIGMEHLFRTFQTFADAPEGQLFVVPGSSGYLEVSLNQGDAAKMLGVRAGAPLELRS